MKIKVLGGCCNKCDTLLKNTNEALAQLNIVANVEKITDFVTIAKYGVMKTPALVINEKVFSLGKVSTKEEIIDFLQK